MKEKPAKRYAAIRFSIICILDPVQERCIRETKVAREGTSHLTSTVCCPG